MVIKIVAVEELTEEKLKKKFDKIELSEKKCCEVCSKCALGLAQMIDDAREEERNKKSRKLLVSIMKQMKKQLKELINNSYLNDDPQEAESIECALREFECVYKSELKKLKSGSKEEGEKKNAN